MDTSGIVPDIIDDIPREILQVKYANNVNVDLGKELTPTQVKDQPEVAWNADDNELYALIMTDPDAPSRENPTFREILHWLVINIPGNKLSEGQTIAEYRGSGPPKGSGLHRYVFLVFKQAGKITTEKFISKTTREGRLNIKTRDYIAEYKLGTPLAGNYYEAQYDEYVDILRAQTN